MSPQRGPPRLGEVAARIRLRNLLGSF